MTTGIKLYHRCPFCPPGHGDMAVDTDRIIDWLLANPSLSCQEMPTEHFIHPAAQTLVFNPDHESGVPCDHLIAASYNSMLFDAECSNGPSIGEATVDFIHPWISRHEESSTTEYFAFLFEGYGDETENHPAFGSLRDSWTQKWIARAKRNNQSVLLYVFGFAKYVERPQFFFSRLPRCYEMWTNEGVLPETARDMA